MELNRTIVRSQGTLAVCRTNMRVLDMAENRKGSSKFAVGPWSKGVAQYFDEKIKRDPLLTRDKVANEAGFAESRMSGLLNGGKTWYLEDVDRLCNYFGLDVVKVLKSLNIKPGLSDSVIRIKSSRQNEYGLVADRDDGEIGTETDEGFDSP